MPDLVTYRGRSEDDCSRGTMTKRDSDAVNHACGTYNDQLSNGAKILDP